MRSEWKLGAIALLPCKRCGKLPRKCYWLSRYVCDGCKATTREPWFVDEMPEHLWNAQHGAPWSVPRMGVARWAWDADGREVEP